MLQVYVPGVQPALRSWSLPPGISLGVIAMEAGSAVGAASTMVAAKRLVRIAVLEKNMIALMVDAW